jgi:Uma2 family endonuclease
MNEPRQGLITVEEFAAMTQDDDWTEEVIDGVLYRSPPGYAPHGITCGNLAWSFGEYRQSASGVVSIGSGLVVARNPDSVLAPDLQFWSVSRPPDTRKGWPTVPPVFVAEVVDRPADYSHVMLKVPLYLAFGVDLVWVIRPDLRDVCVYRLADQRKPFDRTRWATAGYQDCECQARGATLDGGAVLPGFSCKVADLFA